MGAREPDPKLLAIETEFMLENSALVTVAGTVAVDWIRELGLELGLELMDWPSGLPAWASASRLTPSLYNEFAMLEIQGGTLWAHRSDWRRMYVRVSKCFHWLKKNILRRVLCGSAKPLSPPQNLMNAVIGVNEKSARVARESLDLFCDLVLIMYKPRYGREPNRHDI
ncbi:hypothetical protein LXL04_001690 [Taraxacum kok-saghyz]